MKIFNTLLALLCAGCLFAQENAPAVQEELVIKQENGQEIYGVISKPDNKGKHGVAIVSHGFNGTHHSGKDYFAALNDMGYAVYTFDFPCGSVNSRSDNNTMNMSISDEKNALMDIVAYFQKQKDVDKNKIVLIGESQGGLVSALAAAELKRQISDLILIYPALCIPDNWNSRYPKVEDIPEISEIWGVRLGKKFMMDIRHMQPYETIGRYRGRVLIIHGTDDMVVPLEYSTRAAQTYSNATLKIIDKAGHGFNPTERVLSNRYVKEFLLTAGSMTASAQWERGPASQPSDGLKDAYKEYFKIGVAVNQRNISDPDEIAVLLREFNSITAENDMKPQPTEPEYGKFNWENADRIANFCREHGIKMRGHTLMWHSQIGEWMYQDEDGNLLPKEQFYANMKHHIQAVVGRYKDVVYCWDVVNEAVADSPVPPGQSPLRQSPMFLIAGEEFIYKAFEYAREADPDALLFYNDYNDAEPDKSRRIYELVKRMKDAGVPVDGIGMQGHYNIYGPSEQDIDAAITRYGEIVDHIHITELDIRINTESGGSLRFDRGEHRPVASWEQILQTDEYATLFKVLRKHKDVIDCVTFWNLHDGCSWLGVDNAPLLIDKDLKVKNAYYTVKNFDPKRDNAEILDDFVPSELNQPGQEYPMVNSQGYVRLRVNAPQAKSVIASLRGGTVLHKGRDGFWWGTTPTPEDEGFHYYHLTIDGGVFNDPGTENFFGSTRWESGVEVPAHDRDFYAMKQVPHGKVSQVWFWSESTKVYRRAFVYTPPEYDSSRKNVRYPVLYLQHGWGENEWGWWNQGHANLIMDNLIAEGRIEPFIIVMTYGMTNDFRPGQGPIRLDNRFQTVLCDELVPYIDASFRTIADRPHRAMAGLSMGGMETHSITLARPEMFSYFGLLSGGIYTPDELKDIKDVKGIFIGCGSKENPDHVRKAADDLREAGYNAKGYVSEGTAHEFLTWRRCLYEMAPMLFR